jgi:putative ABC transport system permease protein
MRPRWRKVLADLWGHLVRFVLVTLSLAIGMFSVGMIAGGYVTTLTEMESGYARVNPADIRIVTESFDESLIARVSRLEGVTAVDGEKRLRVQLFNGDGEWENMVIRVLPEDGQEIDQVQLMEGTMPEDREMLIDIHRLEDVGLGTGDTVLVQLPSGTKREFPITGLVRDQTIGMVGTSYFVAPTYGYVTFETLPYLEAGMSYDALLVTVDPNLSAGEIEALSREITALVEGSGRNVTATTIFAPTSHPNSGYVEAVSGLLALLGFLSVFLSGFLVFNAMSALFAQQIQYIGIMKAIGARKRAIIRMYMVFILIFGLLALTIAIPLSAWASAEMGQYLGKQLNYAAGGFQFVPLAVVLQVVIALVLPQAAGILPILQAARVSVQEAITTTGIDAGNFGKGWVDRQVEKVRGVSRPLLISLRNTFRRKGRLVLTLITLSLGGAVFIATFNVRASLESYIDDVSKYILADVSVDFDRPYRTEEIRTHAEGIYGVAFMEPRGGAYCQLLNAEGEAAESVEMLGAPADSELIEPILLEGRWIIPGDRNAIVLNEAFSVKYPDLAVGDTITLYVNRREVDWTVVGFFQFIGRGYFLAYVPLEYLNEVTGNLNHASNFQFVATPEIREAGLEGELARRLDVYFREQGFAVQNASSSDDLRGNATSGLDTLTVFLLVMSGLTALVGSISLTGTMGMNVMERTREIGVMRAIGATDRQVMKLVIVEGIIIGMISWLIGAVLAFPISYLMSYIINTAVFGVGALSSFSFTATGFLIWLAVVSILSILASILPANNAAHLTIREVLSYE